MTPPVALTVAGTDSGGAAGIAADLTTFAALGVHGACVVTAVTAQDTTGVHDVHAIPQATVDTQLDAVFDDLPVAALKTGMLGTAAAVERLAARMTALAAAPALVVDPVLVATSGSVLGDESVRDAYVRHLLPVATVVTPNLDEARSLAVAAGLDAAAPPERLAAQLTELCAAVVLTGGTESGSTATDWLAIRGADPVPLPHPVVPTRNDHGTGCTYSAALAAHLAYGGSRDGRSATSSTTVGDGRSATSSTTVPAAARAAAAFTTHQLGVGAAWDLGRGRGPLAHTTPTTPCPATNHEGDNT